MLNDWHLYVRQFGERPSHFGFPTPRQVKAVVPSKTNPSLHENVHSDL